MNDVRHFKYTLLRYVSHSKMLSTVLVFMLTSVPNVYCTTTVTTYEEINVEALCYLPNSIKDEIASYANVTDTIIDYFIKGPFKGETYRQLEEFVDTFGNRIVGTKNLENAIDHMINMTTSNGLENVHTEDVLAPYWNRGEEYAMMLTPRLKKLAMLGLGYSTNTTDEGIVAQAIVVKSFEELDKLPDCKVEGKIVVYDEDFVKYGVTVKYRSKGASKAAKKGAVAALIRSVTPYSHATPHTGMMTYEEGIKKIPIAAITHEDADLLWRLQKRGKDITLRIVMPNSLTEATSRNTIAEIEGYENKKSIVLISGHIDSWDVGDGAMDDGGGSFISLMAPIALKKLGLRPRRTLRTIFWTAEELGLIGSREYQKRHKDSDHFLNFVMESDIGVFKPFGISYQGIETGRCIVQEILKLFASINTTQAVYDGPESDVAAWVEKGIPGGGLYNDNKKYFWYHHSEADRINVLNSDDMDKAAALWAGFSYIVADLKNDMPRKPDI